MTKSTEDELREALDTLINNIKPCAENLGRFIGEYALFDLAITELVELRTAYEQLTGKKFSDRCYHAIKSRMERAEEALSTLRPYMRYFAIHMAEGDYGKLEEAMKGGKE